MTTPSTARKAGPLLGTGSQTAWPFTFKVFAAGDVKVTIANSSGVETVLVLNTDYSVALNANQDTSPGGTITYPISGSALPVGSTLTMVGDLDYDQPLDLPSGGNFSPLAIENQLDRQLMQTQQLKEQIDRSLKFPVSDEALNPTLPAQAVRAGTVLAFHETTGEPMAGPSIDTLGAVADALVAIDTVATNVADVVTAADNIADVNTVATNIADVNSVVDNLAAVQTVAADLNEPVSEINTVAVNIVKINAVGDNITDVVAVADNMTDVNTLVDNLAAVNNVSDAIDNGDLLTDVYQGAHASDPTTRLDGSALQAGDLYFNTAESALRAYSGTLWVSGTAGTVSVQNFSGDATTVAFTLGTAPAGENNTQVYVSGVYQQKDTYSVSGTTLTFSSAPPTGTNNIEVVTVSTLSIGETDAALVSTAPAGGLWTTVQGFINKIVSSAGSAVVGFIQAGTGAVTRWVQDKLRETVSVKDFGAVGDGVANDTAAIQAAVDAAGLLGAGAFTGATVYFPPGKYKITSSIALPGNKFVSLKGCIKASVLAWYGGNNGVLLSMDSGSDESKIYIEQMGFLNGNSSTGLIGIQMCKTPGNAIVNVTVRDNFFNNLHTVLETYTETDQIVFQDNYVLTYAAYGIRCRNGVNSNFFIRDNHFRDGSSASWAVYHEGGSNILVDGNTVQTGHDGASAFYFSGVSNWVVNNTYFEVSAAPSASSGGLIRSIGSKGGRIESNYTTGASAFAGYCVVYIDAASRSIDFGSNYHAVSGGTPYYFAEIASGATNMRATGYQLLTGGVGQWVGGEYIGSILQFADASLVAPLASPAFTGMPTFRRAANGGEILNWGVGATTFGSFYAGSGGRGSAPNGTETGLYIYGTSGTGRSINAGGTVNASGADYAEYMVKAGDFTIAKGDICGVDANGKLTNVFADAVTFVVKSTNPSYVGGDTWSSDIGMRPQAPGDNATKAELEAFEQATSGYNAVLETERQKVDRVAFAGQVPVNLVGAVPGQFVVPLAHIDGIKALAVNEADMTLPLYLKTVGKVIAVEPDGRARIIVKVV
jgi:Pectate lyase superfamily protein